jgi:thiamine pyrophosphate-dependent acetolactate synthase large subunit-like protein
LCDEADVVLVVGSDLDRMMTQNWLMPAPPKLVSTSAALVTSCSASIWSVPDFAALAASFGVAACTVDGFGPEFEDALRSSVAAAAPSMIVVHAALTPPPPPRPAGTGAVSQLWLDLYQLIRCAATSVTIDLSGD